MKQLQFLFLLFPIVIQAQLHISGIVKEASTNKVLPFASISIANSDHSVSDIDGQFIIELKETTTSFKISYIGYETSLIAVEPNKNFYQIYLIPQVNSLNEVTVSYKENPALVIIQKVIENKNNNNPEKKLSSFKFNGYNKTIITANPDSIKGTIDSVFVEKNQERKFTKIDSSNYKFKKIISKQHLFQTEKTSLFQFNSQGFKETVLGTKMSGFKEPIYDILGLKLQSFSLYDTKYELFETKYKSPIANKSLLYYDFKLLDSTEIDSRNTYIIFFKDKNETRGLRGLLYIDKANYGIAKAIMRAKSVVDLTGIHEYNYLPKENLWFPKRKILKIAKGKNDEDIKLFGETMRFDADKPTDSQSREKTASDYTYLLSDTYFSNFFYNIPVKIKNPSVSIDIKENAIHKDEYFWNQYRKDSLDTRSPETYIALDSIISKNKIEKKLFIGRKILSGYIPIGPIDLDSRYFLSFNNYESFRFGLGGKTSEKFSKIFKIEGYTAYGIKDGTFKYSLGVSTRVGKYSNSWIGGAYTDDIREIASIPFAIDKRPFKLYDPRPINISTFYNYKNWRAYIETKIIPKTESIWQLTHSLVVPKFNYLYYLNNKLYSNYNMTTAIVSLQWNPFSDFMQTPNGRIEVEKRFPKFTFQFTQSIPKILNNDFNFSKIDFRAEYEKKHLNGQKTALKMTAGYSNGAIPLTHLYSTAPNNLTKDNILQRITIGGKNSFETMYFNEFFSSEFVSFQLKHSLKKISIIKKIRPTIVLVSRMAWGNMKHPEQHVGLDYKTLNEGYFESGIEFNQIFKGLGLSGFYRYGPNGLSRFEDNLAVKLTFIFNLGI